MTKKSRDRRVKNRALIRENRETNNAIAGLRDCNYKGPDIQELANSLSK